MDLLLVGEVMLDLILALTIFCDSNKQACAIGRSESTIEWYICHPEVKDRKLKYVLADLGGEEGQYINIHFECGK